MLTVNGLIVANGTYSKPIFTTGSGSTLVINAQVGIARTGAPADNNDAGMVSFDDTAFSVDADGYVTLTGGSGPAVDTMTGDDGVAVSPDAAGNFNWNGLAVANATHATSPVYFKDATAANTIDLDIQVGVARTGVPGDKLDAGLSSYDDTYFTVDTDGYVSQTQAGIDTACANFIVDPAGLRAEYTTLTLAIAAASSGDTIFVKEGTYTEDLTLKAGVNIVAFINQSVTSQVEIIGKCTATFNGSCMLSGIRLTTNSDFCLSVTGTSATVVNLTNCYINALDNTAIEFTSTSSTSEIYISQSRGDIGTTGISFFSSSSSGVLRIYSSDIRNSGSSLTVSTSSAGSILCKHSNFSFPITTSGTNDITIMFSEFNLAAISSVALILGGSGNQTVRKCYISTGSATSITATSALTGLFDCIIDSSNATSVIDGAGTVTYAGLTFGNTGSSITTTTQVFNKEGPSRKIGSANIGSTNSLLVTNTDNTNTSSNAWVGATVGGSSGGDPFLRFDVTGDQVYAIGIDNTDSDLLKITTATPSTGDELWTMTSAGERTMPLQPAFLAVLATDDDNQTGAGTAFMLGDTDVGTTLTEIFDQGGDFTPGASGGAYFTAPVTGRYYMNIMVGVDSVTAATTTYILRLITSNRSYNLINCGGGNMIASGSQLSFSASTIVDMDSGDTAKLLIYAAGEATDVIDVLGTTGAIERTTFSGYLVC